MNKDIKKVFIKSFGCQMNVRDSEVVSGLLRAAGYELIPNPEDADIIIFNTCSVRQHAEDKVWSEIGRISKRYTLNAKRFAKQLKSSAAQELSSSGAQQLRGSGAKELRSLGANKPIIGLIGCMAQNYKDGVFERSPEVDFVAGPSDIDKIPGIIKRLIRGQSPNGGDSPLYQMKIWETDGEIRPEEIYHTGFYEDKEHVYVVISEGCSNYCSYCVVPHVRGELHNRNYKDILEEIENAVKNGITKITLLGQNVNAYKSQVASGKLQVGGGKSKVDFVELLMMVNQISGLAEFSFITSHPRDTTLELFKAMADCDKLKKYLHLPVQSGSDRILKIMNRGYTRKYYLDLVDNYRKILKGGLLSTDIIVGFPGETEADFKDTYNLAEEIRFDSAYIFKYSPRPHTEALKWTDDVPKDEKERRHALILKLQKAISKEKNAKI